MRVRIYAMAVENDMAPMASKRSAIFFRTSSAPGEAWPAVLNTTGRKAPFSKSRMRDLYSRFFSSSCLLWVSATVSLVYVRARWFQILMSR